MDGTSKLPGGEPDAKADRRRAVNREYKSGKPQAGWVHSPQYSWAHASRISCTVQVRSVFLRNEVNTALVGSLAPK